MDIIIYKDADLIYAPDWFVDFEGDYEQETDENGEENGETVIETEAEKEEESNETDIGTSDTETETETEIENGWISGNRGFEQFLTQEAREAYYKRLDDILSGNRALTPVYFSDGTLLVTVVDYSEEFMENLIFAFSIILALLIFVLTMLICFSSTMSRINRLANNVRRVESGELNVPLRVDGNDEISALASDVNSMRNSVIENMTKEQKAWEANTELITAMSHDIRTPLTVMLGYLDLLEMQNDDESKKEYITACKDNALRLKQLSDDMFSYFLVFGKRELNADMSKTYGVDSVIHMVAERNFWLEEKEFTVEMNVDVEMCEICIDVVYFGRVLDNLFSNIEKYADRSQPILVDCRISDGYLELSFKNYIRTDEIKAESNGIGTKTCRRIMEKMNGSFDSSENDGYYTALLRFPIV